MKLLMATHYFDSHNGGIEIVAARLARELARRGVSLTWIASDATNPPEPEAGCGRCLAIPAANFTERHLGFPLPLPGPRGLSAIRRSVREADAVLLHDSLYPTNVAARVFAWWHAKPVVIVQHIGMVPYSNPVLRFLMAAANLTITKPMLASAHQVVFISEITQRHFSGLRFARQPILLFNGVDTTVFYPAEASFDRASVRARHGLPGDTAVALFVGRFVEKKGLRIIERVARLRPDISFVLAGWGAIDPLRWGLPNVHVLAGLTGAALADVYRASDLLLLPSTGEGLPLVVQEALACGLPVICGAETATADAAARGLFDGVDIDERELDATARRFADRLACYTDVANDIDVVSDGHGHPRKAGPAERHAFARDRYSWARAGQTYLDILIKLTGASPQRADPTGISEARRT